MKRCLYCGHENSDTAQTCEKCGNQLLDNAAQPGSDASFTVPQETDGAGTDETEPAAAAAEEPVKEAVNEQVYEAGPQFQGENGPAYGEAGYGYAAQASAQPDYEGQAYGYASSSDFSAAALDEQDDYVPQNRNLLRTKARKMVKNPLFFLAILAFTASVVLGVIYVVTGGAVTNIATLSNTLRAQVGDLTVLKYVDLAYNFINGKDKLLVSGVGVLLYVPSLVVAIALWMIFFQTTNRTDQINTSGFTFARVLKILEFIVVCVGILAGIGVSVYNVVTTAAAKEEVFMLFLCVIALLVVILLSVLTIMYYLQVIFAIKLVRTNCKTGDNIGRFPGFVIFVTFLAAICQIATIIPMAPDDYFGLAYGISRAAWFVLMFLWEIIYLNVVRNR